MNPFVKLFVFFLLLILCFNINFSYCYQPDVDGCFAEGSACTSDLNCISKLCVNSVCQPNHSQVMDISRILNKDALFGRIEITAESELKALLFYNEYVSNSLYQKVSLTKKVDANWVNNELYSTNNSDRVLIGDASGYFDDGDKVYFNVAGYDNTSGGVRNYFEIFGGEGISNTIEYLSHKPQSSLVSYQNNGIFTERYRINSSNKSIYIDCVNTNSTDYHNQLLYGNPTLYMNPSVVYNFTDYSSAMASYSCTQSPVFFDKVNSKVAITLHDKPGNVQNPICPYKYCEASTGGYYNFPYSCGCLNEYELYHTPFVKINSNNDSVLFSFSQNNLKECIQTGSEFICKNYILTGLNPVDFEYSFRLSQLDIEVINNISYIAAVVDSSKILLCNKNPITDSFDCRIVVDLNYLKDSSDAFSKVSDALIDYVSIEPYDGNLVLAYAVQSYSNSFKENGVYLGYFNIFGSPIEGICGDGVIDEGENCSNCPEDVICQNDYYCEEGICIKDELDCSSDGVCNEDCPTGVDLDCGCVSVDGSCVSNSDCCSGLVCGAENKCVSTSSASTSIDVFNLFVDGNKLYYKIKCNKEVPIDINLYKGEVSSKNLVRVNDVCGVEEKNGLILDSVEEKIIYTAIAKIQPLCKVCTKTDYLVVEDLVNPTSVPDNSLIFTIVVLLSVVFLLNKKYNIKK